MKETKAAFSEFGIADKGYSIKSFSYGLEIEQQLSDQFSISFLSNFTQKKVEAWRSGYVPMKAFNFNYFKHSLLVNTLIADHWLLGAGATYGVLDNMQRVLLYTGNESPYNKNEKEIGALAYIGYRYKGLSAKLTYYGGIKLSYRRNSDPFKPIQSINFSLNYRLKILDRISLGGRKVGCPAMD